MIEIIYFKKLNLRMSDQVKKIHVTLDGKINNL
jgi:hypothetical protein